VPPHLVKIVRADESQMNFLGSHGFLIELLRTP
jgi:hypothetical protein